MSSDPMIRFVGRKNPPCDAIKLWIHNVHWFYLLIKALYILLWLVLKAYFSQI